METKTVVIPSPISDDLSHRDRLMKSMYTATEMMRLSGITRKQVSYWAKIGLVIPAFHDPIAGVGKPALFYTAAQVVKTMVAAELRRAGFAPRQVQQIVLNLEEQGLKLNESKAYLLTDGHSVYFALSNTEVVDVLKHHRQMLLLLPLHEQVAKLRKAA